MSSSATGGGAYVQLETIMNITIELMGRPYLFFFNYVQWVLYILDGDLLNSALLV